MVVSPKERRWGEQGGIERLEEGCVKVLEIIVDNNLLVGWDSLDAFVDHLASNNTSYQVNILIQQLGDGHKTNPIAVTHLLVVNIANLIEAAKFISNLSKTNKENKKVDKLLLNKC